MLSAVLGDCARQGNGLVVKIYPGALKRRDLAAPLTSEDEELDDCPEWVAEVLRRAIHGDELSVVEHAIPCCRLRYLHPFERAMFEVTTPDSPAKKRTRDPLRVSLLGRRVDKFVRNFANAS